MTIATSTPSATTDLLRRAAEKDPRAWRELVDRYTPVLRSRAAHYRLQDADARDAMQNTWMLLDRNLHRIQDPERLGGWLATTMSRECLAVLRTGARLDDAACPELADPDPDPGEQVVEAAGRADAADAVRRAIAGLPEQRRRLVHALFVEDRPSYAEVARRCGVPVGSIGPTRARILDRLRVSLAVVEAGQRPDRRRASMSL